MQETVIEGSAAERDVVPVRPASPFAELTWLIINAVMLASSRWVASAAT